MTVTGYAPDDDSATYLDPDHAYTLVHAGDVPAPVGLIESHRLPDGRWCEGYVAFAGQGQGRPEWVVIQAEPLTLTPSIRCPDCGNHGYIEGGRWRPA